MTDPIDYWVVSERPRDFPHHVVARRMRAGAGRPTPTGDHILAADLDGVERRLPRGLTWVAPGPGDDPRCLGVYV